MRDDDDGMTEISHAVQHFSLGLGVEGLPLKEINYKNQFCNN